MAEKKVTKREWFEVIIGIVEGSGYEDKDGAIGMLKHEIELLDKKSGKSKETKVQKAHGAIMAAILEVLGEQSKPITITEMLTDERLQSYTEESKDGDKIIAMTNQKLSSMVKKLVDTGEVIRTEEKKKAYFSLPTADGEDAETENE